MNDRAVQPVEARSGWRKVAARIDAYERLIRLDKPIGTLLLLWPTLSALWLASFGTPSWVVVGIFTLGTLLMRSAGCAINDYADREFDAHVERTAKRPLPQGEIAPWEALALAAALAFLALLLILPLNRATLLLSVPALAITIAYPFFKRFFCFRKRSSASLFRLGSRWRLRRPAVAFPRSAGGCSASTCSGSWRMTPSTRWSTGATT